MTQAIPRRHVFPDEAFPLGIQRARHRAVPMHTHDFSELVIVTDGHGIHQTGSHEDSIHQGDVFIIHGDRSHGYDVITDMVIVNVLFDLSRLPVPSLDLRLLPGYHALFTFEPAFRQSGRLESRLQLTLPQLADVTVMLDRLEEQFTAAQPGWQFAALAHFMELIAFLCRCYTDVPREAHCSQAVRLADVVSFMEENYRQTIRLDDLAAMAHMSRSTLLRAFRLAFGRAPIDYLIRLRIDHAADMLRDTDLSITDVARQVGFPDSNYLSRQFRSITGLSPRAYRRRFTSETRRH